MFVLLSKIVPLLIYPLGFSCLLLLAALLLRRRQRVQRWLVGLAVLLLWVSSSPFTAYGLARSLEWRYPAWQGQTAPTAEVIVVLGGGTESADAPRPTVEVNSAGDRVLYAAELYHQGKAPVILVSGGNITWLGERSGTPAAEMKDLLLRLDVPEKAIWVQDRSLNTHEDAVYSAEILNSRGVRHILLVTSAMHMPRSVALFQKQNLETIPAPTDYTVTEAGWADLFTFDHPGKIVNLLPNTSKLSLTTNALKEYIGIWTYRFKGWLD